MVLLPGFKADRVDDKMGMDVVSIPMSCHHDLKSGNGFRKLARHLMRKLRCDAFIWVKGLHQMIKHPTIGLLVQALGVHKFLQCKLGNAIDAGNQFHSRVVRLCISATIGNGAAQTLHILRPGTIDHFYNRHQDHRFRLRI